MSDETINVKQAPTVPHVICPFCGEPYSRVVDTREGARRRRECTNDDCKRRYNTREVLDA